MKQTTQKPTKSLNMPKTSYYTLKELFEVNKHFSATITIRVRHTKLIDDGAVAEIGTLTGGQGRPQKVYALTPVTQLVLDKAKANDINLVDNSDKLVNAISVSTASPRVNPVSNPSPVTN